MGDSVPSSKFVNDLPIQNSEPYNRHGPYQCSWFAAGCVAKRQALTEAWTELINQSSPGTFPDRVVFRFTYLLETASCEPISSVSSRFHALYVEVLVEATHMRATTNPHLKHIQTLFYPPIFQHHQLTLDTWYLRPLIIFAHHKVPFGHERESSGQPDEEPLRHNEQRRGGQGAQAHLPQAVLRRYACTDLRPTHT